MTQQITPVTFHELDEFECHTLLSWSVFSTSLSQLHHWLIGIEFYDRNLEYSMNDGPESSAMKECFVSQSSANDS